MQESTLAKTPTNESMWVQLDSRKLSDVSHKLNAGECKDSCKLHPGESKWTLAALYETLPLKQPVGDGVKLHFWLAKTTYKFHVRPCAMRSCHNRDMPKISSKYAFAHLKWQNVKSVQPTIVKVYIFGKLFLQGIQKWLYFCGRGKSFNIMADQKLKFC